MTTIRASAVRPRSMAASTNRCPTMPLPTTTIRRRLSAFIPLRRLLGLEASEELILEAAECGIVRHRAAVTQARKIDVDDLDDRRRRMVAHDDDAIGE